jgi:uncharacterized protein (DUF1501 family)
VAAGERRGSGVDGGGSGLVGWAAFKAAGAASRRGQRGRRDIVIVTYQRGVATGIAVKPVMSAGWLLIRCDRASGRLGPQQR